MRCRRARSAAARQRARRTQSWKIHVSWNPPMVEHRSSIPGPSCGSELTRQRSSDMWIRARRQCPSGEMLRRANDVLFRCRVDERLGALAVKLCERREPIERMHELAVREREKERQHGGKVNRQ